MKIFKDPKVLSALVGGVFLILGNLLTAYGPNCLSYGNRPEYTNTEAYNHITSEYPRLNETLERLWRETECYYRNRDITIEFLKFNKFTVDVEIKMSTEVQNIKSYKISFRQKFSAMIDTKISYFSIEQANASVIRYSQEDMARYRKVSSDGLAYYEIPIEIPKNGKIKIDSHFTLTKPRTFMEPLIMAHLLIGNLKLKIIKPPKPYRSKFGVQPFTFNGQMHSIEDKDGNEVFTIAGPLLTGQGVGVAWKF